VSDKEFPPSIKRLLKARREGKILKSPMIGVAIGWWSLLLALFPAFSWVRDGSLVQWSNYRVWTPQVALFNAAMLGIKVTALLVGVVALSGLGVGLIQSKGLFLPTQLLQGLEQYRPSALFGKVKQGTIDSAAGLLRAGFIALLLAPCLWQICFIVPESFFGREQLAFDGFSRLIKGVFIRGGVVLLFIAAFAYWLARWRFFGQLKMSLQELKDEHREDEGDPHTKAARKHEHRVLLFSDIEKRVKRSKVVVVRSMPGRERNKVNYSPKL
jgi:type III secretion protein U